MIFFHAALNNLKWSSPLLASWTSVRIAQKVSFRNVPWNLCCPQVSQVVASPSSNWKVWPQSLQCVVYSTVIREPRDLVLYEFYIISQFVKMDLFAFCAVINQGGSSVDPWVSSSRPCVLRYRGSWSSGRAVHRLHHHWGWVFVNLKLSIVSVIGDQLTVYTAPTRSNVQVG